MPLLLRVSLQLCTERYGSIMSILKYCPPPHDTSLLLSFNLPAQPLRLNLCPCLLRIIFLQHGIHPPLCPTLLASHLPHFSPRFRTMAPKFPCSFQIQKPLICSRTTRLLPQDERSLFCFHDTDQAYGNLYGLVESEEMEEEPCIDDADLAFELIQV